jgi:hypothetical protein
MLEDIITGEDDPEHLASLALGHLRVKIPQLRLALEGKIRSHQRFLLRRLVDQIHFVGARTGSSRLWSTAAFQKIASLWRRDGGSCIPSARKTPRNAGIGTSLFDLFTAQVSDRR